MIQAREICPDVPSWISQLLAAYVHGDHKKFIDALIQYNSDRSYRSDCGIHGFSTFRSWETVARMLMVSNASIQDEALEAAIMRWDAFCRLKNEFPKY